MRDLIHPQREEVTDNWWLARATVSQSMGLGLTEITGAIGKSGQTQHLRYGTLDMTVTKYNHIRLMVPRVADAVEKGLENTRQVTVTGQNHEKTTTVCTTYQSRASNPVHDSHKNIAQSAPTLKADGTNTLRELDHLRPLTS